MGHSGSPGGFGAASASATTATARATSPRDVAKGVHKPNDYRIYGKSTVLYNGCHLVICHSHGKSLINGGFNGKIIYKWAIFHDYVK